MFASPNYEKCLITSENDSNLNLKENASKNMEKKNNWRKIKNYGKLLYMINVYMS